MPRTNVKNAFDDTLTSTLAIGGAEMFVDNAIDFPSTPFYVVIEPFEDGNREYLEATGILEGGFTVIRNLAGSVGDVEHLAGATVRVAIMAQHIGDLWDSVEAIPAPVPQTFLHDDLTDVATDDHHTKYTDGEAAAAAPVQEAPEDGTPYARQDAVWVAAGGGDFFADGSVPMTGAFITKNAEEFDLIRLGSSSWTIGRIATNTMELQSAVGISLKAGGAQRFYVTGAKAEMRVELDMNSQRITDVLDPVAAQDAATKQYVDDNTGGDFLPLTGGTLTGDLDMGSGPKIMFGNGYITETFDQVSLYGGNSVTPTKMIGLGGNGSINFFDAAGSLTYNWNQNTGKHQFFKTLDMQTNVIQGVADPTTPQDAATKAWVEANFVAI